MARTTEQVFQAHVNAVMTGDVRKVLADYADDAILMTVDGAFVGKAALQSFFTDQFSGRPITKASIDKTVAEGDTMLVEWSAESELFLLRKAVDTYIIREDKILRHTTWFRWIPK
jgi:ketosteroid isomerase-like protein